MLAWIRSPRGSVATAVAVAAVAVGLLTVPIVRWHEGTRAVPAAAQPSPTAAQPVAAVSVPVPAAPDPATPTVPPVHAAAAPAVAPDLPIVPDSVVAPAGPASPAAPSFDIVRVDPHGDAVVAGRGLPNARVALVDGGRVLAEATADASGQFALLPPALPPGDHYLTLQVARNGAPSLSSEGVAVSVAADAAKPMVALLTPDQPARVLSDGSAQAAGRPGVVPATAVPPVAIQSVETGGGGTFTASGVAKAGSLCRLYLNGAFLTDVTAGADGRWSVKVEKGMRAGRYTVRADQIEAAGGAVVNRAEVPFDFPASAAIGHAKRMLMAKALAHATSGGPTASSLAAPGPGSATVATSSPAPGGGPAPEGTATPSRTEAAAAAAIIKEVQSATVIHGDSLWRISRKMLGHGINYTEIYASNTAQIRNPKLIYPGQIFVVPHRPAP